MTRNLILTILFLFTSVIAGLAQSTTIGSGTFTSPVYGPANTVVTDSAYSRHIYIYPSTLLGGLQHGDTISSLEFRRDGTNALIGNVNMKIFLKMTDSADLGTTTVNWLLESISSGVVKVYDKDPTSDIGSTAGFVRFGFNINDFAFDTSKGENLQIFIEYTQSTAQTNQINWAYDNASTQSGYAVNQVKYIRGTGKPQDRTNSSNERHPQVRINYPRYSQDAQVNIAYALGKLPLPHGNPDSVKTRIQNVGKNDIDSLKIYMKSSGVNNLIDSTWIYNLKIGTTRYFTLPALLPVNKGIDTLTVQIASDENSLNNSHSIYREEHFNIYSYKDPFTGPNAGGIGFNGQTGDFVAKFHSDSAKKINQVSVAFAFLGTDYQMGIWSANDTSGLPDTLIYMTDSLKTVTQNTILPVLPSVDVEGDFYVGIRQLGNTNVGFGYQDESPVRINTFFYATPYGNTNWIDFAPDAPFRPLIEPRLQEQHDLAAITMTSPSSTDTFDYLYIDTIAPQAVIVNYGWEDQLTPFNTTYEVYKDGILIYTSTVSDTLSSGLSRTLTFAKTLFPNSPGKYITKAYTQLPDEQVVDNDTMYSSFVVDEYADVIVTSIDVPKGDLDFKLLDTMAPRATIQNLARYNKTITYTASFEIFVGGSQLVYKDTVHGSIAPNDINQITFDTSYFPTAFYFHTTRVIITPDSLTSPDTFTSEFNIIKKVDVLPSFAFDPIINGVYEVNIDTIYPVIRIENAGTIAQGPFKFYTEIRDTGNKIVWRDSIILTMQGESSKLQSMDEYPCDEVGDYKFRAITYLAGDEYPENDTLNINFTVQKSNDVTVSGSLTPLANEVIEPSTNPIVPQFTVENLGKLNQTTSFDVVLEIYKDTAKVYTNTQQTKSLIGLASTVNFSNFVPNIKGIYRAVCYTKLPSDQVRDNDTLVIDFTVGAPYDIEPFEIVFPKPDSSYQLNSETLRPKVWFRNNGFLDADSAFDVRFEGHYQGSRVYSNVKRIVLNSEDSILVQFDSSFQVSGFGQMEIWAISSLDNDYKKLNDTLVRNVIGVKDYDVGFDSIVTPGPTDTFLVRVEEFTPTVIIKNLGDKDITSPFPIYCKITSPTGSVVYNETNNVPLLDSAKRRTVILPKPYICTQVGEYIIAFTNGFADDQEPNNNILTYTFYSDIRLDPAPIQMVFPPKDTALPNNIGTVFPVVKVQQMLSYNIPDTFPVILEIKRTGSIIYTDTVWADLKADESRDFTFSKALPVDVVEDYSILVYSDYIKEQNRSNDTLVSNYSVMDPNSIVSPEGQHISVYPNPVSSKKGELFVKADFDLTQHKVQVFSAVGQQIGPVTVSNNSVAIPKNLPEGVYFIRIQYDNYVLHSSFVISD
jgi:hypothetical protein